MATITLTCSYCKEKFQKSIGEYNRQINKGNTQFYCSRKCANIALNSMRKKPDIEKICPVCGKTFVTTTKAKGATFCSRVCASKGSVNDARRKAGRKAAADHPIQSNAKTVAHMMKRREAWKYEKLKEFLEFINEQYEFESTIGNFIYDLVLPNKKIIFEFDGPEHKYNIKENDKNETAKYNGYLIYRIKIKPNTVIDPSIIYKYLK